MPHITIPAQHRDDPMAALPLLSPRLAAAGHGFTATVYAHVGLSHRIVEGARYRTAQINGCVTCQSWRAAADLEPSLARKGGDPSRAFTRRGDPAPDEAFYAAVADWRSAPVFSERERLAIEHAERMGERPHSFEDDEPYWTRMHAAFSDAEIVELTYAIAAWIGMGRVLHTLGVDPRVCDIRRPASAMA